MHLTKIISSCIRFLALIAIAISMACETQNSNDQKLIEELWKKFEHEYNRGNAQGVANLYASDATRTYGDQIHVGRDQILSAYQEALSDWNENQQKLEAEIKITFIHPDIAIVDGSNSDWNTEEGPVVVIFTVIVKKTEGKWEIVAGRPRGSFERE